MRRSIDLFGFKLYAPWKLFIWWLAFDAQAPDVFARAGALAALGGVLSGALAIGGAARADGPFRVPTTYGSARWADFADVRQAGLLNDRGIVLGLYGTAICVMTVPSMCSRWRRPGPARAWAWSYPRCSAGPVRSSSMTSRARTGS